MRLHHIAILTQDLEASIPFWRDILGLQEKERKVIHREGVEVAFLAVGDSLIELVQPTDEESSISRQVHQPGTKLHHFCLEVENIEQLHTQLTDAGIQLVQDTVQVHDDGTQYFFVHPKSTGGVLLEIYETIQPTDG